MSFIKKSALVVAFSLTLTGCNVFGPSTAEEIHTVFEGTVSLENDFAKQGTSLSDLEEQEQVIYNKITEMGAEEIATIHKLADEAIAMAEQRKSKIEQERENILSAKEEFEKVTQLLSELKDENVKKAATNSKKAMDERYSLYEEVYKKYTEGIENDIALYQLLKADDLTLQAFQEQLAKNNEIYKEVDGLNKQFNEKTTAFNDSKKEFHKAAGLKVKNKEEK